MPATPSTIMPASRYLDAPAAIDWLCQVIGFTRHLVIPNPDGTIAHAELALDGGIFMLGSWRDDEVTRRFKAPRDIGGTETGSVYVVAADPDAVFARATEAGAEILAAPHDTDYASHECSFKDPEGHTWTVGTYDPWQPQPPMPQP